MRNPLMRLIMQDYMAGNANLYLTKCFGGASCFHVIRSDNEHSRSTGTNK